MWFLRHAKISLYAIIYIDAKKFIYILFIVFNCEYMICSKSMEQDIVLII